MSYDSNKVHHSQGIGNIPFAWENKPGERKPMAIKDDHKAAVVVVEEEENMCIKLPPPPYYEKNNYSKSYLHDLNIPLPPCAFVIPPPPSRSSSRRGIKKEHDPFLIAYKECTKSSSRPQKRGIYGSLRNKISEMSCKSSSCSVKDDTIVRISHLSISKSQREVDSNSDDE